MSVSLREQLMAIKSALNPVTPKKREVENPASVASTKPSQPKKRKYIKEVPVTITVVKREPRVFTSNRPVVSVAAATPLKQGDFNKPDLSKQGEVRCGTQSICNKMAVYK